jgi:phage protein D
MSLNLDRYIPTFTIKIDGKLQSELQRATTSVEVDENLESAAMFSFDVFMAADLKNQTFQWIDHELLDPESNKDVEISLGYVGETNLMKGPAISGRITAITPNLSSSGAPHMRVSGYDHSFLLMKSKEKKKRSFENRMDYSEIVEEIAKDNSLMLGDIDSAVKPPEKVIQSTEQNDYNFIKLLAKNFGYEFFIRDKKLYFRKPKDGAGEIITLQWGRDILSFNPRKSIAQMVSKVTVKGHNPNNPREPYMGTAGLKDLGLKGAKIKLKSSETLLKQGLPVSSNEEAKAMAKGMLFEANSKFIEGTCECNGMPEIRPGTNVIIEGVGNRFSGKYYVTAARHSINEMGYKTSFSVRRGAFDFA